MYADHYGLSDQPFQLTPDPRYYFDSATHRKAMAYLGYGLAQGEGFIVITGDIGAGKTTLVAHLMATIDKSRLTAVKLVSTQIGPDDMLRCAAQAFGISPGSDNKAALLGRIERFLKDEARAGKRVLLIVDEAQNLPEETLEELRMLSNFQAGGQALLQIFLLGQPEFRDRVKASPRLEQLRQRVIATHHLEPMGAAEVGPYVEHRLTLAGWTGRPHFTAAAYATLHAETGGVPRRLNLLAARVLLLGAVEGIDTIEGQTVAAAATELDTAPADQPEPASRSEALFAPAAPVAADPALARRLAALEARFDEQERALHRVLSLLVEWVEGDDARPRLDALHSDAA
ncbi:XrtA/PEP-CTERM system-associated ATPase [Sphingomonas sp. 1P06PA]|uniref:XrtA/PEP-CTERM system-associated ATPase n=1 Tax=Sphingomonas sp. 1P06PA TaxID=554121 RepID=UPI0039A447A6